MLASVVSRQRNYDEATALMVQALEYDKRAENSIGIAADLIGLGQINERKGDLQSAYVYYLRALKICTVLNLVERAADVLGKLAEIAASLNKVEEAHRFESDRERVLRQLEDPPMNNQ
jgi:tetratricopeptide (TPR) repeat protein